MEKIFQKMGRIREHLAVGAHPNCSERWMTALSSFRRRFWAGIQLFGPLVQLKGMDSG
jgi:hypothetical protein